jgi:hypothetical protein
VQTLRVDDRRERQAKNEMLFRRINEQIEDLGESWLGQESGERAYDFVCECQDTECTERIALTVAEYESIRASGRRFVVVPSAEHVDMTIENVVDMSSRYWVVEKTDESGDLAEAEDPRD